MTPTRQLERTRSGSADPENPSADRLREIVDGVRIVAVVGISRDPAKAARRVPSYMAAKGYEIIPGNPNADRILGREAVGSLDDVDEAVDMVQIFRPSDEVAPFMRAAAARPERPIIWLQEGIRNDGVARELRERGLTVVQDLCFYKVHRAAPKG